MNSEKMLPAGTWLQVARLPLGITSEELSGLFQRHGVNIPPEYISIRQFTVHAGALISLDKPIIADLLNFAMHGAGAELDGIEFHSEPPYRKKERPSTMAGPVLTPNYYAS